MKKIILFMLYVFMVLIPARAAYALTPLNYDEIYSPSLNFALSEFLAHEFATNLDQYQVAPIDLNGDGIEEHVLRQKNCDTDSTKCTHLVVAEKKQSFVLLSKIRAKHLMIAGSASNGIKDILAFKNKLNDYNFDIYVWSPPEKTYILKAE